MVDYFAHNWYHDPFAQGGYALYAATQITNLFAILTRPATHGRLHVCGDATSTHRGRIAGALSSAWRAVAEVLVREGIDPTLLEKGWERPDDVDWDLLKMQVNLSFSGTQPDK